MPAAFGDTLVSHILRNASFRKYREEINAEQYKGPGPQMDAGDISLELDSKIVHVHIFLQIFKYYENKTHF